MRKGILAVVAWMVVVVVMPMAQAAGKAKHVVVMVWDGMRPDFVTEEYTPNLYRMSQHGVTFANHHSVYMSATEVNGVAIATGAYPGHSRMLANKEYRPEIDAEKFIHMEGLAEVRKGDELTGGHFINRPTTVEILRGKGISTAVAGAKPVAFLHDRMARLDASRGVDVYAGRTLPEDYLKELTQAEGAFPATGVTPPTRNDWTTKAMINELWRKGVPAYSLLWLNEPDFSQHETGPGSPTSLAAIKNADDNLGRVLQALEAKGVLNETDFMLVSDHGFSTVMLMMDTVASLKAGGFNAVREFKGAPAKDDAMVVSNGGASLIYVTGHDEKTIGRMVEYLQTQDYTGVVLTRKPVEGAFTFAQARIESPTSPDIWVSMRWTADKSNTGAPGMVISDASDYGPRQGMHVSLSRYDMHNTLIAAGPDFRHGMVNHLATGNVDIAPTALWILGVKPPQRMDGRVLTEALNIQGPKIKSFEAGQLEATHKMEAGTWHQYMNFTVVNGVSYFDEGNGRLDVAK